MVRIFNEAFTKIYFDEQIKVFDEFFVPILSFQSLNDVDCLAHVINNDGEYSIAVKMENDRYTTIDVIPASIFVHLRKLPPPANGLFEGA